MNYKHLLANIALVISSVLVTYSVIEFFLFPAFVPITPLKFQDFLGPLRLLSQSSKTGLLPRDYIALIGDSYAQGEGDWLLETDPNTNRPFHSAHIIHEVTGRDVVSFGKGGSGSIDGIMIRPIRDFNLINSGWLYNLDKPSVLLVYFYEGNDLSDNLKTVEKYVGTNILTAGHKLEKFNKKKYNEAATSTAALYENAHAAKFFWYLTKYNLGWDLKPPKKLKNPQLPEPPTPGIINQAQVGSRTMVLPDGLQSPALELSDDELHIAVKAFELALAGLHRFFPEARLIVTIIPAPLSAYQLVSSEVSIQPFVGNRASRYSAAQVSQKSNAICELVAAASRRVGAEFFDVRGSIRSLAERRLIHGPKDWRHFNRHGYTELGKRLSAYLERPIEGQGREGQGSCVLLEREH